MRFLPLSTAIVVLLGLGCGDDAPPGEPIIAERAECENLDPVHCLMPYPSSRFLVEDTATETGRRVQIDEAAFPLNQFGETVSRVSTWNRFDGFSPMTSIIAGFEGKLDQSNMATEFRIGDSLLESSPTILLDAETGERVAHIAEIDEWPNADDNTTTFYMRPAQRLEENRRYIVALRDLVRVDGTAVEPSAYFKALRDDDNTDVDELEARRENMEDIFTILGAAGVARENLILAWDFHTASGQSLWGPMMSVREDGFQRYADGTDGVGACTVDSVEEDVNDQIWRRIRGTFTVPLYMLTEYEGTLFNRDADGNVVYNRAVEAPFEVVIPPSVRDRVMNGEGPGRMLMYGHGLLGAATQVSSGGTRFALERNEMVGFGTDYWGLAESDEAEFLNKVVTQMGNFDTLGERLVQGTLNSLLLQKVFSGDGACGQLPEMMLEVGEETLPLGDVNDVYYYGISQGGIMGATIAALSEDIDKYVLQVGAIGYSLMVRRSFDFDPFEKVFELWYTDKLDRDWFLVSTQTQWDLAEPATYAPHILGEPLPGIDNSNRAIVYQTALWDTQVPNTGSDIAARTMGLPWFSSSVYEPWGVAEGVIESTSGPVNSGYMIFSLDDVEPIPVGVNIADEDNSAHNDLRYLEPMLEQLDVFCTPDGQMEDFCPDGSCALVNTRR